ncbi:RNA polymerase sigma factor [Costertonia aggregata]|uniref:Sigma-70 family RNA polymerase sigma factor n=1 Tax=Costertonia aggregata TaxID=343403 RepID=A0A7H9ANP8_9FLAO|nr:sigma-70 family RNA polymerase sigma factor [Costertonia aggregata]QLG45072.1 sigma-70 family RNA polymerase sigma factor [Costertonia aggregata]
MTDQEIIHQLKKGNEACLKHLYQHLGMIKSLVSKNSGNEDDALDIFQEAVIVFYKKVMSGDFELRGKISSYLYEVSRRLWLNQLNRRKRHEVPSDMSFSPNRADEDGERQNPIALQKYVENALEKLGEPCKSLLESAIFLGTKMEEIAKKFNYSGARSASQQKLRCLKKLRGHISYDDIIALE